MNLNLKAIHPEIRTSASPSDGKRVSVNPPALLWPTGKGKTVRYEVRLSQNPKFPKRSTVQSEDLRWAMFNPHRKLSFGTWYWQYGVSKRGRAPVWSETFTFEVSRSARVSETPTAEEMIAACPEGHPRLWVAAGELEALRRRLKGHGEVRRFVRQSEAYLGENLPGDALPPAKGDDALQVMKFRRWGSRRLAEPITRSLEWLAPAYLMTGDERFGREAVRRALHVSGWDPDGYTGPVISDFADGACMRTMVLAYDACFGLLSEEERELLRGAITCRASRFFGAIANNMEARVFGAHFWQHLLREFTEMAFALLHEIPDAEAWASYVYELWVARFPAMGGEDGGWANGNSYFGMNIETALDMPALYRRLAGVNLFRHPWYRNAIDFMIYTWPPHSLCDSFGDGTEMRGEPTDIRLAFVEELGRMFRNPYALWYSRKSMEGRDRDLDIEPMLAWYLMRSDDRRERVRAKAPRDLPQAKAFRDVGIVSMHTDLADTERDLMVGFRCSPYGATSHAHACQNGFNILYGGARLFRNTGYYIAAPDKHTRGWYKHTQGHNSLLVDGKGQTSSTEGYGWIPRFLNSRRIGYCLGDASNAYGDAGVVRFRRHFLLLRPWTIVIYDDLEADHPAEWGWLLHSGRALTASRGKQRLRTRERTARAQVDLMGSTPLRIEVDDRFDPPAINWSRRAFEGKTPAVFPRQWHATVSPETPCETMRYLAVMQVRAVEDATEFDDPVAEEGWVCAGDWMIRAELDASKPASLMVQHRDGRAVLGADVPSVRVGKKRYRTGRSDASILVELSGRQSVVQRSADELPEAAR